MAVGVPESEVFAAADAVLLAASGQLSNEFVSSWGVAARREWENYWISGGDAAERLNGESRLPALLGRYRKHLLPLGSRQCFWLKVLQSLV